MSAPVRDPSMEWRILLSARLTGPVEADVVTQRWQDLCEQQGWPAPPVLRMSGWDAVLAPTAPVALALDAETLLIGADHDRVDGLGLLRVLDALVDGGVASTARGVADRPPATGARLRRLREALLTPPARLDPGSPASSPAEVIVGSEVAGRLRTGDLVHAVARVGARATGRRRPVAVAIGAGRPGDGPIRDDSALLRLTGVERLDRAAIETALATAPRQPAAHDGDGRAGRGLASLALRVLAPRLGSTFLVSHLGRVAAPALADLRFAPVTGSGGLALGAVTLAGSTRLTLRASGHGWDAARLDGVLAAIVAELQGGA